MGGPGSGSWYRYDSRSTVEDKRRLPIRHFAPALRRVASGEVEREFCPIGWWRNGEQVASILVWAERYQGRTALQLCYTSTSGAGDEKVERDYHVMATSTPSNLPGNPGRRWWFICPLSVNGRYCGRRVAALYGGSWFGCRHCHGLTYQSTRESHQLERLAAGLAGELGFTQSEIVESLRDFDRETRNLMYLTNRITRNSKKTERALKKVGLRP